LSILDGSPGSCDSWSIFSKEHGIPSNGVGSTLFDGSQDSLSGLLHTDLFLPGIVGIVHCIIERQDRGGNVVIGILCTSKEFSIDFGCLLKGLEFAFPGFH